MAWNIVPQESGLSSQLSRLRSSTHWSFLTLNIFNQLSYSQTVPLMCVIQQYGFIMLWLMSVIQATLIWEWKTSKLSTYQCCGSSQVFGSDVLGWYIAPYSLLLSLWLLMFTILNNFQIYSVLTVTFALHIKCSAAGHRLYFSFMSTSHWCLSVFC